MIEGSAVARTTIDRFFCYAVICIEPCSDHIFSGTASVYALFLFTKQKTLESLEWNQFLVVQNSRFSEYSQCNFDLER